MEESKNDLITLFLNKNVKVVHKRGDLVFFNRGKFLDSDNIFIKIHDIKDDRPILIRKDKIDNIDLTHDEEQ